MVEPCQIRAARAMLGWTQDELAARSGVAKRSIAGLETEVSTPKRETMDRIVASLAAGGIEFRNGTDEVASVGIRRSSKPSGRAAVARPPGRRLKAGSLRPLADA